MRAFVRWLAFGAAFTGLASCSGLGSSVQTLPGGVRTQAASVALPDIPPSDKLKHIIVIIQENRSLDNLFNGFCVPSGDCADTVMVDPSSLQPLAEESMKAPYSPLHDHAQFITEYDYGKMDGFSAGKVTCNDKDIDPCPYPVLAYVPASETGIYRWLATFDGELSDATFETVQGPSFPAHLYAISGQSGGYQKDHYAIAGGSGSCGTKTVVKTIDMTTAYPGEPGPQTISCQDFRTIFDLLANKGHTWRYYSDTPAGFFSATQAISHLYNSPHFKVPSTRFLRDIKQGQLDDVTFIMPWSHSVSDHPGNVKDPRDGPHWVNSLVNAIGTSQFWDSSAIVIWWDDWGGWFDHVPPPVSPTDPDPFEYGFRVPLIVISPYARLGRVDHTPRTFVSALRLIEETFHAGTLNTTDRAEPDGLNSMFDFHRKPRKFVPAPEPSPHTSHDAQPSSLAAPDPPDSED